MAHYTTHSSVRLLRSYGLGRHDNALSLRRFVAPSPTNATMLHHWRSEAGSQCLRLCSRVTVAPLHQSACWAVLCLWWAGRQPVLEQASWDTERCGGLGASLPAVPIPALLARPVLATPSHCTTLPTPPPPPPHHSRVHPNTQSPPSWAVSTATEDLLSHQQYNYLFSNCWRMASFEARYNKWQGRDYSCVSSVQQCTQHSDDKGGVADMENAALYHQTSPWIFSFM